MAEVVFEGVSKLVRGSALCILAKDPAHQAAASGAAIGAYNDVRAAVLNAEASMYLSGVAPASALRNAANAANAAISAYNLRIGG